MRLLPRRLGRGFVDVRKQPDRGRSRSDLQVFPYFDGGQFRADLQIATRPDPEAR